MMWPLFLAIIALIAGYFIYGKVVEHVFHPDDRICPAVCLKDNVDYEPMCPQRKHS